MKQLIVILFLLGSLGKAKAQDTILVAKLDTVKVIAKHNWTNQHDRYRFNQMRYYVTIILPYLNEATKVVNELAVKEHDPNSTKKDRKRFVKAKEQEIRDKFEQEILELNETQGTYLVKLIARQTGQNIYQVIKEYKGLPTALKWLAWAKVHGFDLNKKYDPTDEPVMERVMESLGYPLPDHYL